MRSGARRIALGIVVCKLNNSQLHFRCVDNIIFPLSPHLPSSAFHFLYLLARAFFMPVRMSYVLEALNITHTQCCCKMIERKIHFAIGPVH